MTKRTTAVVYLLLLLALVLVLIAGPSGPQMTFVVLLIGTTAIYAALMGWRVLRRRGRK